MYIGIDFGTTYSEIAALNYFKQIELLMYPGEYAIPSVFYYDGEDDGCIGKDALERGSVDADNMVLDIKMRLGEKFTLSGREFSSEEIVRRIYKEILQTGLMCAETKSFETKEIEGIVLSFPNRFNDPERELLLRCASSCMGEAGGPLPISGAIKEPVAAAIYYIEQNKENPDQQMQVKDGDALLVYDLGGGTCDIALVKYNSEIDAKFEVVDSDMIRRGGRDWDTIISEELTRQFDAHCQAKHRNVPKTPELVNSIRQCAERMKKELSIKGREMVKGNANYQYNNHPQSARLALSFEQFNQLTESLLKETMDCLKNMYDKHASQYQIKNVICVGGGSNMLQVKDAISACIPDCTCRLWEPEYAIVKGATLYASMLGRPKLQEPKNETGIALDDRAMLALDDDGTLENETGIALDDSVMLALDDDGTLTLKDGISITLNDKATRALKRAEGLAPDTTTAPPSRANAANCLLTLPEEGFISDIVSFTYGIEYYSTRLKRSCIKNLIIKNSRMPVSGDYTGRPRYENVEFARLPVYESDSELEICELDDPTAKCIGELQVQLPASFQSVETNIQVHITLNSGQILEVTATLPDGTATSAVIERTYLSDHSNS